MGSEQIKNDSGYTFKRWMREVEGELVRICGLGTMDLADKGYYDAWQDDMTPLEMAMEVLEDEGFPFEESDRR